MRCALLLVALPACLNQDPLHDAEVARLGGETNGAHEDEYHRPGQPCVTCHGHAGPARSQFAIAGTIFYAGTSAIGVGGATVLLEDSSGVPGADCKADPMPASCRAVQTNCVGNFWIGKSEWDPQLPVKVVLVTGPNMLGSQPMQSVIHREPSCAGCHADPAAATSPGHIYLVPVDDKRYAGDHSCPVSPTLGAP